MPYLIDGHNLIPNVAGLKLAMIDDEIGLIERLQTFCRRSGKRVEVYFDNAQPGHSGPRRFGRVTAHFVRQGSTADTAIRSRLRRLGRRASNWTVVSSDQAVQSAARAAGARLLPAESFARELGQLATDQGGENEQVVTADELDEWLRLFGDSEEKAG